VSEWKLFDDGTIPDQVTAAWYVPRDRAPHLEQEAHRPRLLAAHDLVVERLTSDTSIRTVGDFGAGDGGLLSILPVAYLTPGAYRRLETWGYDLCPANVAAATSERHVNVSLADYTAPGAPVRWPDLIVMTETLEHLLDPHRMVREAAKHCKALICSSPADEAAGSADPVHVWAWDEPGYYALVAQNGWRIASHTRCGRFQLISAVLP
jgi:hypothetical protein